MSTYSDRQIIEAEDGYELGDDIYEGATFVSVEEFKAQLDAVLAAHALPARVECETVHVIEPANHSAAPKHAHVHDHYSHCTLHGIKCCNVCCVHEGQCDFGGCHADAVTVVDTTLDGRVVERRPACARHANHGNYGVGYRLTMAGAT